MDAEFKSNSAAGPVEEAPRGIERDVESYYIHRDEVSYGPESVENLRLLCETGWLQPEDLVWKEGAPEWMTAGAVFASFFQAATRQQDEPLSLERDEDTDDFFLATAVRFSAEQPWPWSSFGIAIAAHVALLLLAVALFQFFPIKFLPYESPPASQEPPLEVTMVTEPEPALPPPPPPDSTPPPPEVMPPPLPDLAPPDMPPPPPAPAEMPVPSLPPLPLPVEPVALQEVATIPVPHKRTPQPHKVAETPAPPPSVAPQESPPPTDAGPPEYLADPRPVYPFVARQRRQEGTVLLLVTLDEAGNPSSVTVEQSSGYSILDKAAQKQVAAAWRFKPGQGSKVLVPVEFHLDAE